MKQSIRRISAALSALVLVSLAGCSSKTPSNNVETAYADKEYGFQLEAPAAGEEVAVMHTSKGDITMRFFPEAAPKTVQNFKEHAKSGYYDGLTFHRVIENFMIQGGDPKGNGTGGESIFGDKFEDEFDQKLLNLNGAVSMANSGPNTNGSQFFINQSNASAFGKRDDYTDKAMQQQYKDAYEQLSKMYGSQFTNQFKNWKSYYDSQYTETYIYDWIPDEVWALYEKHGGNISLDGAWRKTGGHTVFAQVIEGMDVVEAIAAVSTDDNNKPVKNVTIDSIELVPYGG